MEGTRGPQDVSKAFFVSTLSSGSSSLRLHSLPLYKGFLYMVGNMTSKIFRVIPEQFEIQRKREWLLFLAPMYVILRNVL